MSRAEIQREYNEEMLRLLRASPAELKSAILDYRRQEKRAKRVPAPIRITIRRPWLMRQFLENILRAKRDQRLANALPDVPREIALPIISDDEWAALETYLGWREIPADNVAHVQPIAARDIEDDQVIDNPNIFSEGRTTVNLHGVVFPIPNWSPRWNEEIAPNVLNRLNFITRDGKSLYVRGVTKFRSLDPEPPFSEHMNYQYIGYDDIREFLQDLYGHIYKYDSGSTRGFENRIWYLEKVIIESYPRPGVGSTVHRVARMQMENCVINILRGYIGDVNVDKIYEKYPHLRPRNIDPEQHFEVVDEFVPAAIEAPPVLVDEPAPEPPNDGVDDFIYLDEGMLTNIAKLTRTEIRTFTRLGVELGGALENIWQTFGNKGRKVVPIVVQNEHAMIVSKKLRPNFFVYHDYRTIRPEVNPRIISSQLHARRKGEDDKDRPLKYYVELNDGACTIHKDFKPSDLFPDDPSLPPDRNELRKCLIDTSQKYANVFSMDQMLYVLFKPYANLKVIPNHELRGIVKAAEHFVGRRVLAPIPPGCCELDRNRHYCAYETIPEYMGFPTEQLVPCKPECAFEPVFFVLNRIYFHDVSVEFWFREFHNYEDGKQIVIARPMFDYLTSMDCGFDIDYVLDGVLQHISLFDFVADYDVSDESKKEFMNRVIGRTITGGIAEMKRVPITFSNVQERDQIIFEAMQHNLTFGGDVDDDVGELDVQIPSTPKGFFTFHSYILAYANIALMRKCVECNHENVPVYAYNVDAIVVPSRYARKYPRKASTMRQKRAPAVVVDLPETAEDYPEYTERAAEPVVDNITLSSAVDILDELGSDMINLLRAHEASDATTLATLTTFSERLFALVDDIESVYADELLDERLINESMDILSQPDAAPARAPSALPEKTPSPIVEVPVASVIIEDESPQYTTANAIDDLRAVGGEIIGLLKTGGDVSFDLIDPLLNLSERLFLLACDIEENGDDLADDAPETPPTFDLSKVGGWGRGPVKEYYYSLSDPNTVGEHHVLIIKQGISTYALPAREIPKLYLEGTIEVRRTDANGNEVVKVFDRVPHRDWVEPFNNIVEAKSRDIVLHGTPRYASVVPNIVVSDRPPRRRNTLIIGPAGIGKSHPWKVSPQFDQVILTPTHELRIEHAQLFKNTYTAHKAFQFIVEENEKYETMRSCGLAVREHLCYVVDEITMFTRTQLRTMLTRAGNGVIVALGDLDQIRNEITKDPITLECFKDWDIVVLERTPETHARHDYLYGCQLDKLRGLSYDDQLGYIRRSRIWDIVTFDDIFTNIDVERTKVIVGHHKRAKSIHDRIRAIGLAQRTEDNDFLIPCVSTGKVTIKRPRKYQMRSIADKKIFWGREAMTTPVPRTCRWEPCIAVTADAFQGKTIENDIFVFVDAESLSRHGTLYTAMTRTRVPDKMRVIFPTFPGLPPIRIPHNRPFLAAEFARKEAALYDELIAGFSKLVTLPEPAPIVATAQTAPALPELFDNIAPFDDDPILIQAAPAQPELELDADTLAFLDTIDIADVYNPRHPTFVEALSRVRPTERMTKDKITIIRDGYIEGVLIHSEYPYRHYLEFDSVDHFYSWSQVQPEAARCYHEVVPFDNRRFVIDIDGGFDESQAENATNNYVRAFKALFSHLFNVTCTDVDIVVVDSSGYSPGKGAYKYSIHIRTRNWWCNAATCQRFAKELAQYVGQYGVHIDDTVYKSTQNFRCLGSTKLNENRWSRSSAGLNDTWVGLNLDYQYGVEPLEVSAVAKPVAFVDPAYATRIAVAAQPYTTGCKLVEKRGRYFFTRGGAGYCHICERNHDSQNMYVWPRGNDIVLGCYQMPKGSKKFITLFTLDKPAPIAAPAAIEDGFYE